jgi:hypothetical protein
LILTTAEKQGLESTTTAPAPTITSDAATGTTENTGDAVNQASAGTDDTEMVTDGLGSDAPTPTPSKKEIRFLVSSKHMILVSPAFRAMLQHSNFKEGVALSEGAAEVPLPDDEPTSWKIILDIIHHNTRSVPQQVDLQTMTNIAVLVDKYQLGDLLWLHAGIWINHLKKSLPKPLAADLVPWLCISWVFKLETEFKHLTCIPLRLSTGDLQNDRDLPIPDRVFRKNQSPMSKLG